MGIHAEDAVSMALTALSRLIKLTDISYTQIGRLEVGTESQTDRSKSIKSNLMRLFEESGNMNVEGVDTYNACYGGTNAVFSTLGWLHSPSWDGRYAVVVTSDIAVQNERFKFTCGGAATAMLFGPNAPMRFDPRRASYISDEHDFYKPVGWHELAPVVDMRVATETYMRALRGCLQSYTSNHRIDKTSLIDTHDYFVFHMNSRYHAHMAFQTVCNFCWDRDDVTKRRSRGCSMPRCWPRPRCAGGPDPTTPRRCTAVCCRYPHWQAMRG